MASVFKKRFDTTPFPSNPLHSDTEKLVGSKSNESGRLRLTQLHVIFLLRQGYCSIPLLLTIESRIVWLADGSDMKRGELDIVWATTPAQLKEVRALFLEYAESLGFGLWFQRFEKEVAGLPAMYAPPEGSLLLGTVGRKAAGCAGLRKFESSIGEMKRLYVRPQFRGLGLGRRLAEQIVSDARAIGYQKLRLDTIVGKMDRAIQLYRQLGFVEIASYRENPIAGALYLELTL